MLNPAADLSAAAQMFALFFSSASLFGRMLACWAALPKMFNVSPPLEFLSGSQSLSAA